MANYECVLRSNYFHVKDQEGFRSFMNTVSGDDMHLWEEKDEKDGSTLFGFGCYGSINGAPDGENGDTTYEAFLKGLQEYIVDKEAVIICEAGNEKLRYVIGFATVITRDKIETISINELAISKAREMLKNIDYKTKMEY